MSDTFELKRCPFCGRRPNFGKGKRRKADGLYAKAGEWFWKPYIGCTPCDIKREFESVEEALNWWNERKGK